MTGLLTQIQSGSADRYTLERGLPLDDALRIAREVGDALDYAHREVTPRES